MASYPSGHVHRLPEDMGILHEVDVPVWIATYNPEKVEFLWCNQANVKLWNNADVEEFTSMDMFSNRSEALIKMQNELFDLVQVRKKVHYCRRTMYPNGKAVSADCTFAPLQIINRNGEEETVAIITARPVQDMDAGTLEANRSHEMLRHSPILTAVFTTSGDLIQSNVTASKFYGGLESDVTLRQVIESCNWQEDHTGEASQSLLKQVQALKLGDSTIRKEVEKLKQGSGGDAGDEVSIWHDMRFIPILDPGTGVPAVLAMEIDITELEMHKLAQEQLIAAANQQAQIFAAVSHELRTPLNGIIGLTEHLLDELEESGSPGGSSEALAASSNRESRKVLSTILKSAQRLNLLINDILDSASLKKGKLHLTMRAVDINEAAEQVCQQLSMMKKNPGVELELVPSAEPLPDAYGDPTRISQILVNLVGNALKFTHQGSVRVSTTCMPCGKLIRVTVTDTGIGIAPEDLSRVFLPFEQADMSAERNYEGTGLGLTLVGELVERHGGEVFIDSEPGQGTTIAFTLPTIAGSSGGEVDSAQSTTASLVSGAGPAVSGTAANGEEAPGKHDGRHSWPTSHERPSGTRPSMGTRSPIGVFGQHRRQDRGPKLTSPLRAREADGNAGGGGGDGVVEELGGERRDVQKMAAEVDKAKRALERLKSERDEAERRRAEAVQDLELMRERWEGQGGDALRAAAEGERASKWPIWRSRSGSGDGDCRSSSMSIDSPIRVESVGSVTPSSSLDLGSASLDLGSEDGLGLGHKNPLRDTSQIPTHYRLHGQIEIMSVDDQPTNHLVLERMFKKTDYKYVSRLNGLSTLALLEERGFLPDIFLLDVMMPGMSGHELCRSIRQIYSTSFVPIIMISAKSSPENIMEGFAAGCLDFICKPFTRKEVLARIRAHVHQVQAVAYQVQQATRRNSTMNTDTSSRNEESQKEC